MTVIKHTLVNISHTMAATLLGAAMIVFTIAVAVMISYGGSSMQFLFGG